MARARAILQTAQHRHHLHARVNGEEVGARVLLIGNNRYEVDLLTLGERERLDRGELQLWAADGWLPSAWEERVAASFTIELPSGRVQAAIDGEPVTLEPPLELGSSCSPACRARRSPCLRSAWSARRLLPARRWSAKARPATGSTSCSRACSA